MIKNDHMAFQVSNMDESIKFYTEALGLRLMFRHVNPAEREDYAFLELDGGNLELLQRLSDEPFEKPSIKPPYCPHLALATDDMEGTLKMTQEKNIPIIKGPLEIEGAEKWLYISDPDNNVIEYIQWLK
jgi:catechol 2,3-dioxygenase-like lactoylglutathione lyase family enzyme